MRFLLTGITGFIGTHLYRRLRADGHGIVAQVRNPARAAELEAEGVAVLAGDLMLFRDPDLVLPEVDLVVHLAGVVAAESLAEYEAINYQAVVDLVECLHRQSWRPARLLFASSLAAVGPSHGSEPHTEAVPGRPVEPYGIAKLRAEEFLRAKADFPTTSFRPCLVLGPGDSATRTLYQMAATGFGFKAAGFDQLLSVVDVDDVVAAILAMGQEGGGDHQTYFVANTVPVPTTRFFQQIGKAMGRERIRIVSIPVPVLRLASRLLTVLSRVFRFTNQLDEKQYKLITAPAFVCSPERLQERTGWQPRVSLDQALDKAVAGYRAEGQL